MAGAATSTTSLYAQKLAMPVIGYLCAESPELFASRLRAFHEGLGETGFVEGRNVAIEYQWAEGQYTRLPALAASLAIWSGFGAAMFAGSACYLIVALTAFLQVRRG